MKPAVDVKAAVSALRKGGVIACPTEAVWGLSCDPDNDEALAHLMRMKERDPAKGVILVAASIAQFQPWLNQLPLELHAPLAASWQLKMCFPTVPSSTRCRSTTSRTTAVRSRPTSTSAL